jgi:hypothetical protein
VPDFSDVRLGPGWSAFTDVEACAQYILILLTATLSGVVLAYHPVYRGRPASMEALDLRKTLIIYTVVGALVAIVCTVNPYMAFVIFGIGGLMRFTTRLSASKSTGYAIVGTVIGMCWGLGLELVAVLATIYAWVMVYLLEVSTVLELTVGGVDVVDMGRSTESYRDAIARAGGRVMFHGKVFKKRKMRFVIRLPSGVTLDRIAELVDEIPVELRGTPDWPE